MNEQKELTAAAIGKRIRAARMSRNWTQMDLAVQLGVTPSRVSTWETGTEQPALEAAREVCALFGWTLDYFFNGKAS